MSFLGGLFFMLEMASVYMTNTFIGYEFYLHCNTRDILSMIDIFLVQVLFFFFMLTLLSLLFYFSYKIRNRFYKRVRIKLNKFVRISLSIIGILVLIIPMIIGDGIIRKAYDFISLTSVDNPDFDDQIPEDPITNPSTIPNPQSK
ncbi:MAG: hypothetical protein C0594_04605, partial [Marinilabiliales bacterium]